MDTSDQRMFSRSVSPLVSPSLLFLHLPAMPVLPASPTFRLTRAAELSVT